MLHNLKLHVLPSRLADHDLQCLPTNFGSGLFGHPSVLVVLHMLEHSSCCSHGTFQIVPITCSTITCQNHHIECNYENIKTLFLVYISSPSS